MRPASLVASPAATPARSWRPRRPGPRSAAHTAQPGTQRPRAARHCASARLRSLRAPLEPFADGLPLATRADDWQRQPAPPGEAVPLRSTRQVYCPGHAPRASGHSPRDRRQMAAHDRRRPARIHRPRCAAGAGRAIPAALRPRTPARPRQAPGASQDRGDWSADRAAADLAGDGYQRQNQPRLLAARESRPAQILISRESRSRRDNRADPAPPRGRSSPSSVSSSACSCCDTAIAPMASCSN